MQEVAPRSREIIMLVALSLLVPACGGSGSGSPSSVPAQAPASLMISPSSATVAVGAELTFTATASGLSGSMLAWSVNGVPGGSPGVGTIVPKGDGAVYSATSVPSPNPVNVTAVSTLNPSISAAASVMVLFPDDAAAAQARPIHLGTSGGNATDLTTTGALTTCCSGTLGSLVTRSGAFFILSNSHVLDKSGQGHAGDPISQPGLADNQCRAGTRVAGLAQSAPLTTSNVDAALAVIDPGAVDLSGSILDLGAAGPTAIAAAPPSSTLADPAATLLGGIRVAKTGRSTGLTCGPLMAVSADVQVDYSSSCGGSANFSVTFHNQVLVSGSAFSAEGDSGSLIVTVDAARPLGLLYAGNGTLTAIHPIADVLSALKDPSTGETPVMVGGPDHPISCVAMSPITSPSPQPSLADAPSPEEFSRVSAVRERFGKELLKNPSVGALGIGTSADQPREGALLVYLRDRPATALPRTVGGVRTRILGMPGTGKAPGVGADALEAARKSKEQLSAELLRTLGIIGVGLGLSKDAPDEPALVLFVEQGAGFAGAAPELDGLRTQIVEGERFRTFRWGTPRESRPRGCCGER